MAEKLYYSMGEVTEMFDVNPSLIRYWGEQFKEIAPKRNKKGNRMFTPDDIATLKMIYHLVKERGMTIEGARKALKAQRANTSAPRDAELLERLQRLRSMLLQVREELGSDAGVQMVNRDIAPEEEIFRADSIEEAANAEEAEEAERTERVEEAESVEVQEPATLSSAVAEPATLSPAIDEPALFPEAELSVKPKAEPSVAPSAQPEAEDATVAEQPAEAEREERKLPFYEQTLF